MNLCDDARALMESLMKHGGYETPVDVILAALFSLKEQEELFDFAPGELDALIEEAEEDFKKNGGLTQEEDVDPLFAELDELRRAK